MCICMRTCMRTCTCTCCMQANSAFLTAFPLPLPRCQNQMLTHLDTPNHPIRFSTGANSWPRSRTWKHVPPSHVPTKLLTLSTKLLHTRVSKVLFETCVLLFITMCVCVCVCVCVCPCVLSADAYGRAHVLHMYTRDAREHAYTHVPTSTES